MNQDLNADFPTAEIKKEGIKYGIYLGVISFVISMVTLYILVGISNFKVASFTIGGLGIVVMIALSVYFAILLRRLAGGFWTFSQGLKGIFTMLAIAVILTNLASTVVTLVNPEPQQVVFDKTINLIIETMEATGQDEDLIDAEVAKLEKQRDELRTFSFGKAAKGLAINLISYFVLALILAAILKKEKPLFQRVSAEDQDAEATEKQDI